MGRKALNDGRPIVRVSGNFKDTEGSTYGIHWNWGDKVRVKYRTMEFDTIVGNVTLQVVNGKESVIARFDYEE